MLTVADGTRELAGRIEARIRTRTHGRVRGLRVELTDEALVLRGFAPSQYTKQLALDGALDLATSLPVRNKIVVS